MPKPQHGILESSGPYHFFLEFSVPPDAPAAPLTASLKALPAKFEGDVRAVFGFSAPLWAYLSGEKPPPLLRPFQTLTGRNGKIAPGTQSDLWLWLSGGGQDKVFRSAMEANRALGAHAALRLEQPAFHYLDSRDLTGFIDGTANPAGAEAQEAATIANGAGVGGSYLIAMRWVHDLAAFHALPEKEQEKVIGRSKANSVELPEGEKPPTAHISRVEIEQDGEEVVIFRRSVPFGNMAEHGLYFLAFSTDPGRFDLMLAHMYGLSGDGIEDRLTDFSRPTSGAYYFAPSREALADLLGR